MLSCSVLLQDIDTNLSGDEQAEWSYEVMGFPVALTIYWVHYHAGTHHKHWCSFLRTLYYGVFYFIVVESVAAGFAVVDATRHQANSAGASDDIKTLFGGQIIAYFGLYLLQFTLGGFNLHRGRALYLTIVAAVFGLIGVLVSWTIPSMSFSNPNSAAVRPVIVQLTAVAIAIFFILISSVRANHTDGAHMTLLLFGQVSFWFLGNGFTAKAFFDQLGLGDELKQSWASIIFLWFFALASFAAAYLLSTGISSVVRMT